MKLTFFGAAGEVTGSAYLLATREARVLVDFGMFQGGQGADTKNRLPRGLTPGDLDAVLLTHAHLDHCGRLPLLAQAGYDGPIYATEATCDLARLILLDSAKVQAADLERQNRKRERAGQSPARPLYGTSEVEATLKLFRPVEFHRPVPVAPGVEACYVEAGHMLGSASIRVSAHENGSTRQIIFSGDLGPKGAPILRDAETFGAGDVVLLESTYGDRGHKPLADTVEEFERVVRDAVASRGKILVPTFAVGRAQLLLYILAVMFREGRVRKFPVFLDSPMAIEATRIYQRHAELYDEEMQALRRERPIERDLDSLKLSVTADDSKALNRVEGPCLIMAGAGMCNAGRILHHLKANLWKPNTAVLIVGYQAEGSLGRQLLAGAKSVKIFGERIAVKAAVHGLGGFSAHAAQQELLDWYRPLAASRPLTVLVHGETKARDALALLLRERHGIEARRPAFGETLEIG